MAEVTKKISLRWEGKSSPSRLIGVTTEVTTLGLFINWARTHPEQGFVIPTKNLGYKIDGIEITDLARTFTEKDEVVEIFEKKKK